jgi:hypothetical protein
LQVFENCGFAIGTAPEDDAKIDICGLKDFTYPIGEPELSWGPSMHRRAPV